MNVPDELRYTTDHEWAKRRDDGLIVIGITDHAQDALGDITYLELPDVGTAVRQGVACGVVESVKTFSDLVAPVTGTVAETNEGLEGAEEQVNQSPYDTGWLFVVEIDDAGQLDNLLDADGYRALLTADEA